LRDALFARSDELSSRAISKANQKKGPAGAAPPTFSASAGSRVQMRGNLKFSSWVTIVICTERWHREMIRSAAFPVS